MCSAVAAKALDLLSSSLKCTRPPVHGRIFLHSLHYQLSSYYFYEDTMT